MNLRYQPSQEVERQSHPEIEFNDSPKLIMKPLTITYTKEEHCLIECSVNSVRISFAIKKVEIEHLLADLVGQFLALRADRFKIFRKKPIDTERFDFCFLISEDHLVKYHKHELVNFILEFIQGIQK